MLTTKDIKKLFPKAVEVEQLGEDRLFIVTISQEHSLKFLLVSYTTIIGVRPEGICGGW